MSRVLISRELFLKELFYLDSDAKTAYFILRFQRNYDGAVINRDAVRFRGNLLVIR